MKTYAPKPRDIERRWYVVDAQGAVLGRLASEVAKLLRGKHKPIFSPHADAGDHVIVVNAGQVRLTGGKEEKKVAYRHSGYPGGLTATSYARLMGQRPVYVVEKAIRGMLPKNRLGRAMAGKLQVYEGAEHPHLAQKPVPLGLGELPPWTGLPAPKPRPQAKPKAKAPSRPAGRRAASAPARGDKRSTAKRTAARSPAAKRPAAARSGKATDEKAAPKASTRRSSRSSASESAEAATTPTKKPSRTRRGRSSRKDKES